MKRCILALALAGAAFAQTRPVSYTTLTDGQTVSGFRAVAVYLDDAGRPMGARFRHLASGFTLDLLDIQSVPQAFIWVTTFPTSNMGEPHTQEHLLVGKGDKGRNLGSQEVFSLVTSSAFTDQWKTCYHFYTTAGADAFYPHFERTMDALIHPDYTDEEVRREVRNFGVTTTSAGSLGLEEKGTVYNEMVTSMDQPFQRVFRAAAVTLYGPEHPLSFSAGGLPAALRVIKPSDIRRFHGQHYFLGNMGAIISLPKDMELPAALAHLDASLRRLEPATPKLPVMTEAQLPAPRPAPAGRIQYVTYPYRNDQQPGVVVMLWPANRKLSNRDFDLLSLFLSNVGGDPDTNLYRRLIDTRTREADFGIKGITALADPDQGQPVYLMFRDVPVARMNDRDLADVRRRVLDEFARIAAYPDGSAELAAFNERLKGRILQRRRELSKFVNSPPGFGVRGTGPDWIDNLYRLNQDPGFRKSLTKGPELDALDKLVTGTRNIWRDYLVQWKITGADPWIEAAKPDPGLISQDEAERQARAAAETARLRQQYGAASDQEAIRRYQADYDAGTRALEAAARRGEPAKLVDQPPRTLDDQLQYTATKLAGGVPLVASTFDSMTSATAGIALRLDGIPEQQLVYLSMLPALLTGSGVIEDGRPVPYPQMTQRLRNEILKLDAAFSVNPRTGRDELVVRGSGNNLAESRRALEWMKLVLLHPDWRLENAPRVRDLVDQTLGALRNTTQRAEETWVQDPQTAYWKQDNPLLLATSSFMTREHNLLRLRWMLKDGGSPEIYAYLNRLGSAAGSRAERKTLLASIAAGKDRDVEALSATAKPLAVEAARDLDAVLSQIPDSSLAADWTAVCHLMIYGLQTGPEKTLAALDDVRRSILTAQGARMFLIASPATKDALAAGLAEIPASLSDAPVRKAVYRSGRRIDERLRARDPQADHPVFVGLLNENSQGGVFENTAPAASYDDTAPGPLLDFVAGNLYAGHGAHSLFMKTWAAGLAYSNGIRPRPLAGRMIYYAERTPELPQTLQFVINELKKAQPDPALAQYAVANVFVDTRSEESYEARGEAMAADLADGLDPAVVGRFHDAILALRARPDLTAELFRRMPQVYARILPGLGAKVDQVPGGVYFVIGPEKQLSAYQDYLQTIDGPQTRLFRLYPRDFWLE